MSLNKQINYLTSIKGNDNPLFFILGLNAIENEKHTLKIAEFLKKLSEKLKFQFIFKSSFDKANRSSLNGYRSIGLKEGSKVLFFLENDTVLMKKVNTESFAELTKPLRDAKKKIEEKDVPALIHRLRSKKRWK